MQFGERKWIWGYFKARKAEAEELATDEHGISRKRQKQKHGKRRKEGKNFNLLRKQRYKWSGCSGASPSQPLCL
jgi:hypothetical protein